MSAVPPVSPLLVAMCLMQALTFGVGAWTAYGLFTLMLNAEAFVKAVRKLLSADNRPRALKLCKAIQVPVTQLATEALTLRLPAVDPSAVPGDNYRDGGSSRSLEERARAHLLRRAEELFAPLHALSAQCLGAALVNLAAFAALHTDVTWFAARAFLACGGVLLATFSLLWRAKHRQGLSLVASGLAPYVEAEGASPGQEK